MKQTVNTLRLGVNIDHVATVRNARGGSHPDPLDAARAAVRAGADGITAHLREDRRHIRDSDIFAINAGVKAPLNLEMAATAEMVDIALQVRPNAVCIVPERRAELTTEGGLAVVGREGELRSLLAPLKSLGVRLSLFVEANEPNIIAASQIGVDIVELHTGRYCDSEDGHFEELCRIQKAAKLCVENGLEPHAGHGLSYQTIGKIASIKELVEVNIGHFLIGESIFLGLDEAVKKMRVLIDKNRPIDR